MELGKRVRVTKGDHRNDIATITLMVGTGHRRKWRIRFDNNEEIDLHARSLVLAENFDGLVQENIEELDHIEFNQIGNNDEMVRNDLENNIDAEENDDNREILDPGWILQPQAYMLEFLL